MVPAELRYYLRADCKFDSPPRVSFSGDGFTAANLSEFEKSEEHVDDVPYSVLTFRTAITPVKTGDIEIPAAKMQARLLVPGGDSGDPFVDQFFQNFPGAGPGRKEDISAETAPRRLTVESLPKEGKPASFSGAIGKFIPKAAASPSTAKSGEPVTLKLTVEGRGNFDAIGMPNLVNTDGWSLYETEETFNAADAIGFGGEKTFEIRLVAWKDQTQTPGAEFSYFDPEKKKYMVLEVAPVAVTSPGSSVAAAESAALEVETEISSPSGQVGVPLQLQYRFVNTQAPKGMPRRIMVDGLNIWLTGSSRRVELVNMQSSSTMIYTFTVIPRRTGNFTIPALALGSDGGKVLTKRVSLQVGP